MSDFNENANFAYGVYRGVVEYNNDPKHLGRIKARVPIIDGPAQSVATENLMWAMQCSPFGGGPDFGSKLPPPVGSTVFIMYEGGKVEYPIYIGSWEATPSQPTAMIRNKDGSLPADSQSMAQEAKEVWQADPGPDGPQEYLLQVNHRPERIIPFKTLKGSTYDIQERDEVEHTAILDRAGQSLKFDAPVRAVKNKDDKTLVNDKNEARRGLRNSAEGNPLPLESTLNKEGQVLLIDIGGQSISLQTKENSNNIRVISKQGDIDNSNNDAIIAGQKEVPGKSNVNMELSSGNSLFNLEILNNGELKASLTIDGNTGMIELFSDNLVTLNSKSIRLSGDTTIEGNLQVNDSITSFRNVIASGEVISTRENPQQYIPSLDKPSI